jgi:CubicO group peptidase (beta-lactamase class C family)
MRIARPLAALVLLLPLPSAQQRSAAPADAIDSIITAAMEADGLPSVTLVVGRGGTIVKQAAYGLASVELRVPATLDTVYPIASATKSMTSTAVFLLVNDGRLALDDSIVDLLPELPEAWFEVTVRHLLTHTSGLPDVAITPGREPLLAETRDEALAKLREMPCAPPGSGWAYNQTNYLLLKMIVERRTGKPFQDFVRERLFAPLGLTATVFGDSEDVVPGRASMYERRDGVLHPRRSRFHDFMRAAAGVNTSALEWYRWADAWAHGRILPREKLEELWSPAQLASGSAVKLGGTSSYGCGVALDVRAGHRSAGHSGGGTAAFCYFIDEDLLVVLLTNGTTDTDGLVERVAAAARSE